MTETAVILVLLSLACARVTRLVIKDDWPPLLWARERIVNARPPVPARVSYVEPPGQYLDEPLLQTRTHWNFWYVGELVTCPWCASAYVSGVGVLIVWALRGLPLPVLCWLAVWYAAAWLLAHE